MVPDAGLVPMNPPCPSGTGWVADPPGVDRERQVAGDGACAGQRVQVDLVTQVGAKLLDRLGRVVVGLGVEAVRPLGSREGRRNEYCECVFNHFAPRRLLSVS